jgi:pyrophosphatase PpaX
VRFPVVLFDLDGTLIDSRGIILASFRHAATTVLGRDIVEAEVLSRVGGTNLHEQMRAIDPDRVDDLVAVYREHNTPLNDTLEAFPGILDVVATLRERGHTTGLVTAKRRFSIEAAFGRIPLAPLLDVVVCADDTAKHKPDPEPILEALRRLDASREDAAYVGDSPFDILCAKAAHVHAVGVTWGNIHDRAAIADADTIVDEPEELLDVL